MFDPAASLFGAAALCTAVGAVLSPRRAKKAAIGAVNTALVSTQAERDECKKEHQACTDALEALACALADHRHPGTPAPLPPGGTGFPSLPTWLPLPPFGFPQAPS